MVISMALGKVSMHLCEPLQPQSSRDYPHSPDSQSRLAVVKLMWSSSQIHWSSPSLFSCYKVRRVLQRLAKLVGGITIGALVTKGAALGTLTIKVCLLQ